VQDSKIFATNYTYWYSRSCKAGLGMAGTKCRERKLDKEDEKGTAENKVWHTFDRTRLIATPAYYT
jgi:hypothetical protein